MEGAFLRFGGVPAEVLLDNAKALVEHHDAMTREVRFNARLNAFARYWGFTPRACAPYRARTKGKDERGVGSREIARRDERRISMSSKLAQFPFVRELDGFDLSSVLP